MGGTGVPLVFHFSAFSMGPKLLGCTWLSYSFQIYSLGLGPTVPPWIVSKMRVDKSVPHTLTNISLSSELFKRGLGLLNTLCPLKVKEEITHTITREIWWTNKCNFGIKNSCFMATITTLALKLKKKKKIN